MATFHVYSPKAGRVVSLDCYCGKQCANNEAIRCGQIDDPDCDSPCGCPPEDSNCGECDHRTVGTGFRYPIDIRGNANDVIRFFGSSNIQSIKIKYETSTICRSSTGSGDVDNGIKVYLYACPDAIAGFGQIIYGHLKVRENYVDDGEVINRGSQSWFAKNLGLGQLPGCCGVGCMSGFCTCYGSVHVHVNANKGGTRPSMTCGVTDLTTTSVIYSWTKNIICPT